MTEREPISFLATAAPEEAVRFYRDVLGLELVEDSPFGLVLSDDGHMLRVQKVPGHQPSEHTVLGWKVPDIDAEIDRIAAKGAVFSFFPGLDQSERGVWTAPGGDKVAWFKDPAGNTLSLTQFSA